jgi:streptomycin 6-kinase
MLSPTELPESFRRRVTGAFPEGAEWLASLPARIAESECQWQIRVTTPFELSYSYVTAARTACGDDVVVKVAVPNRELRCEIAALQLYDGGAAVRLLDSDAERGLLLLERLMPGEKVSSLQDDEQATRIAAGLMRELWRPLPANHSFPTLADWAVGLRRLRQKFGGGTGPFALRLVETAESLLDELLESSEPPVLLHGDLHHLNILSSRRRPWVAIDPKGVAGERAYEPAALLENPEPSRHLNLAVQRRRIEVLAEELGLDPQRIAKWGAAHAVLSAWWNYEDSAGDWEPALACAEVLAKLVR